MIDERLKKYTLTSLVFVVVFVFTTGYAKAYIDPGTGSYFLQILLAGLFGAVFVLKSYWFNIKQRISALLAKDRGNKKQPGN